MCAPDRAALLQRCLELEAQLASVRQERDDWRTLALVLRPEDGEPRTEGEGVALITSSSNDHDTQPETTSVR